MNNLGYCCINTELSDNGIKVNRGMVRKTFIDRGISYCAELSFSNLVDLKKILEWNLKNNIFVYRMSSDMFPWMSEYKISDLPNYKEILYLLEDIGKFCINNALRISFHPGHFNVLGSLNLQVVNKTIKELSQHGEIMDMMGLRKTTEYPINIHINSTKDTKGEAAKRFCDSFKFLPECVKSRLTVENDDFKAQYTPIDLHKLVYSEIGIPICFDYFHYKLNQNDTSEKTALNICLRTWGSIKPLFHYSSSKRQETGDLTIREQAHSDFILEKIDTYGFEFDLDLEAKAKEKALLKYRWEYKV